MGYQEISNIKKVVEEEETNKKDTRHTKTSNKMKDIDSTLSVIKLKVNRWKIKSNGEIGRRNFC